MTKDSTIIVFQEKEIRRVWHQDEWWFSVVDVMQALTGSKNPRRYWSDLKIKLAKEGAGELYEKIVQLKMQSADGKFYETDAAETETMFRIIQSIPSPKAEPFKLWFAKVAYERVQEIADPELAAERARGYYRDLGYDEKWIETRLQTIAVRGQLTDEWKNRGVREGLEYSILTAEISRATFGLAPSDYKDLKGLKRENLRDHMTNLELIFTMLGEEGTRQGAIKTDALGFEENRAAAIEGGSAAGDALMAYENRTGDRVASEKNFKGQIAAARQKAIGEGKKKEGPQ